MRYFFCLFLFTAQANAEPIEPRQVVWNIMSDRGMSEVCIAHGLRTNCAGMAAWDNEFHTCIIWTRSPDRGWEVVQHELQHCQEGHFHE